LNIKNLEVKIGEAIVEFDEHVVNLELIKAAIEDAGFLMVE
jgi:copper chaperone CopZ